VKYLLNLCLYTPNKNSAGIPAGCNIPVFTGHSQEQKPAQNSKEISEDSLKIASAATAAAGAAGIKICKEGKRQHVASITKEDIQSCLDKGMNHFEISKELGISNATYYNLLKKYGITTRPSAAVSAEDIQSRLDKNMTVAEICDELGFSKNRYCYFLKKYGIATRRQASRKNVSKITTEDIQSRLDKGMTAAAISKELGISPKTYQNLCRKYGITTRQSAARENVSKITAEDIQACLDKNMTVKEISKELGISNVTCLLLFCKYGLTTRQSAARENVSKITAEDIQSRLDKNMKADEIQKELGISRVTYDNLCFRFNIPANRHASQGKVSSITAEDIQSRLDKHIKVAEICEELGISSTTFNNLCHKFGIKTNQMARNNHAGSITKEELSSLIEQGYNVNTIYKMLDISPATYARLVKKFKISTKRSVTVEQVSKITKSDLENLLKEMSPPAAGHVLNISSASVYRLMLKFGIHPSQKNLPDDYKDYSDEQLRGKLLDQSVNNAKILSNEVLADVVDFALGESYTEETRAKVINLIKLFNKVNTNSISTENALQSTAVQDLFIWMQQNADFKQMQKEKLADVQRTLQDIIYNVPQNNRKLTEIISKYIPNSVDDDNFSKAEYILNTLGEADTPETAEKKLAYWDLKNFPNNLLKQAEQYAQNKDGIVDEVKAGEYILCFEEFNNATNNISDKNHKIYAEIVKNRLIDKGKNNYTDAYKVLNIYNETPDVFKDLLLSTAQKYNKNDYIFINELTELDGKIKFCNIDEPTEFEFLHTPSGKVKKGAILPKAKYECLQYCMEHYNQNAFDRFYKFMDKFYQFATIWAPRKFGSSGIKDIDNKQSVYSEIKIKGGSDFDDWRLFATGGETLDKYQDKRYIFDAFGNHDWLLARK